MRLSDDLPHPVFEVAGKPKSDWTFKKKLTGWWYTYPSEKYEFFSWEYYYYYSLLFPIYRKIN